MPDEHEPRPEPRPETRHKARPERRPRPNRGDTSKGWTAPQAGAFRRHLAHTMPAVYDAALRKTERCDDPHCGDVACQVIDELDRLTGDGRTPRHG